VTRSGYLGAASGLSSYAEIGHAIAGAMSDGNIVGVHTIRPAVDVRRSALVAHGIGASDLIGGQIMFAATAWRIKSVIENGLELRLIVMHDD
jgi:hypothetical protein